MQTVRQAPAITAAFLAVIVGTCCLLTAPKADGVPATTQGSGTTRIVVKLKEGTVHAAANGTGERVIEVVSPDTAVVAVDSSDATGMLQQIRNRSDVDWAEFDTTYHAAALQASATAASALTPAVVPNDPCFTSNCNGFSQENMRQINAPQAWSVTTGEPVSIAVLDTGIDATNPDLVGHVTTGPNFTNDGFAGDDDGHGTHVAGIIGAGGNNGIGVAGVDWHANLVSVKVLDNGGSGFASQISNGLRWAADHGARIANLSLGGTFSRVLGDAVAYAQSKGVLVVAAADNDAATTPTYPAAFGGVLSVGATDASGQLWAQSNRGPWVDIVAPGVDVISTYPIALANPGNPFAILSGTSMATPLVSGAAALLWSVRPQLSANGVAERLMQTAASIPGTGRQLVSGRLDLGAALSDLPYGYRLAAADGGVFSYGERFFGSTGGTKVNKPIVTTISTGTPNGYWLVASDGGVFSFGDAAFYGSTGAITLNKPIVGAATTRSGNGYWLVAADGGVFAYGDAAFYGSTGAMALNKPIVAVIPTQTGAGYWLVASDGGVFSFGDAAFYGSTGAISLNKPIVAAGRSHTGNGYWLVASDGGVFSFGDAAFYGSTGAIYLNKPIVAIATSPVGFGYWLVASDGGVFSFGDAAFLGSTGGTRLNTPIVSAN